MNKNTWIQTYTSIFDPFDMEANDLNLEDIAHALSFNCRFNGHCKRFLSVAEHCVLMSYQVPPKLALHALLHDIGEAFLTDVPKPLKSLLKEYSFMEDSILKNFYTKNGILIPSEEESKEIRIADVRMLVTEKQQNMNESKREWTGIIGFEPFDIQLEYWSPDHAEYRFKSRFEELYKEYDIWSPMLRQALDELFEEDVKYPLSELEPCWRCGSGDLGWDDISVRPYCKDCNTWGIDNFGSVRDAIDSWNQRWDRVNK
jgi:hypothetical protein